MAGAIKPNTPERFYPACDGVAITPSDSTNLSIGGVAFCRSIRCGGAGTLTVTTYNGNSLTINGIVAGEYIPIAATRIWSTGTTATNITAFI